MCQAGSQGRQQPSWASLHRKLSWPPFWPAPGWRSSSSPGSLPAWPANSTTRRQAGAAGCCSARATVPGCGPAVHTHWAAPLPARPPAWQSAGSAGCRPEAATMGRRQPGQWGCSQRDVSRLDADKSTESARPGAQLLQVLPQTRALWPTEPICRCEAAGPCLFALWQCQPPAPPSPPPPAPPPLPAAPTLARR